MKWIPVTEKWTPGVDFRRKSGSESGRNPACQFFIAVSCQFFAGFVTVPDVDQIGTRSGSDGDQIWTRLGPDLDQIGTRAGPDGDQSWTRWGSDLDQIGTRSGPDWDPFWSPLGTIPGPLPGSTRDRARAADGEKCFK